MGGGFEADPSYLFLLFPLLEPPERPLPEEEEEPEPEEERDGAEGAGAE